MTTVPDPTPESVGALPLPASPFSGFWRRFGALCFDSLLLGVAGYVLGLGLHDAFAALGPWGRLVGFAIAWPYFGLMNSRLGKGRTLGKRALHIRVVRLDGTLLSPRQGLLRSAVLCLPWFLNGAGFTIDALGFMPLLMGLALMVLGVSLSQLYLAAFNRPSRRVLHDWLAGSAVVREVPPETPLTPVPGWRGHRVVVALLLLLSLGVPVGMKTLSTSDAFAPLLAVQAAAEAVPGARVAGVTQGTNWTASTQQRARTSTYFALVAMADGPDVDMDALGLRLAKVVLERSPDVAQMDLLSVTVMYGYDIGIASSMRSVQRSYSPAQWRERFAP